MGTWSKETPPTWAPNAVATEKGWEDPQTGEVLVAVKGLSKSGKKPEPKKPEPKVEKVEEVVEKAEEEGTSSAPKKKSTRKKAPVKKGKK